MGDMALIPRHGAVQEIKQTRSKNQECTDIPMSQGQKSSGNPVEDESSESQDVRIDRPSDDPFGHGADIRIETVADFPAKHDEPFKYRILFASGSLVDRIIWISG